MTEENQGYQPDQSQDQSQQPVQDSGQPTADSTQEQPQQDSGLQTPQPDQPVPSEAERQTDDSQVSQPDAVGGSTASPGPSGQPAEGTASAFPDRSQQEADAFQKETELEQDRRERLDRLGDGEGEVREGEVQAQRQEHNERTGGGDVPQGDAQDQVSDEA